MRQIKDFIEKNEKHYNLTKKEIMVIELILDGKSDIEIAYALSNTINTARHHIKHIYNKMNVNSRVELIVFIYKKIIVSNQEAYEK